MEVAFGISVLLVLRALRGQSRLLLFAMNSPRRPNPEEGVSDGLRSKKTLKCPGSDLV